MIAGAAGRRSPGVLLAALAWALAACARPPAEAPPLEVELAGCRAVLAGPVCVLDDSRRLRLWARTGDHAALALAGDGIVELERAAVEGGTRFRLEVAAGAAAVAVVARGADGAETVWRLPLDHRPPPAWLQAADALWAAERGEEAARQVAERLPTLPAAERGLAFGLLARVARAGGDAAGAESYLRPAAEAHRLSGRVQDEVVCATALAYGLIYGEHRLAEARAVLDALSETPGVGAETAFSRSYFRALLALNTGDLRSALSQLESAAQVAERLGLHGLRQAAEQVLGRLLQRLGRSAEAAAVYARLAREVPDDLPPCDRGQLLNNLGWRLLLAREGGEASADPTPLFQEARRLFETETCPELDERANVETNLALAAFHGGRLDEARRHLAQARSLLPRPDPRQQLWWWDLEARIALADGRADDAVAHYAAMKELAERTVSFDARWRAATGAATALAARGRTDQALAAYAEAETLVTRASLTVPIDAGRETFVARRELGTRRHLGLLLSVGEEAQALAVARRARSRVLRGLRWQDRLASLPADRQAQWDRAIARYRQERQAFDQALGEDWRLPHDALARRQEARARRREAVQGALDQAFAILDADAAGVDAESVAASALPAPGELWLLAHPLVDGWVGFAVDAGGVRARRLGPLRASLADAELAERLLAPFAAAIRGARLLRVLPYGFLRQVDVHALPFDGDVLLASVPVVYGLDLPAVAAGPAPPAAPKAALVVADPLGDLPAARREARAVDARLAAFPDAWSTRLLLGEQATGDALRGALAAAELLHFAGHASFAGAGGWQSVLRLAGGGQLTVGDILALPRAPAWAFLSGCDTGRTAAAPPTASVGLGHAFLAAGSRTVIAAMRPVDDRLAAELVERFYRRWLAGDSAPRAMQQAQLARYRRAPASDWSSFRVLEP